MDGLFRASEGRRRLDGIMSLWDADFGRSEAFSRPAENNWTVMPSFILALDTAHQRCSAALLSRDGEVSAWKSETVGNKHAERILAMIDELLAECGAEKKDIALTAFGAGPGSFTGLRVACGVAQGIAWALRTDVAAVCNLEADALAAAEAAQLAPGTRLAVMNDARMQEAYSALYEVVEGPRGVREVLAPQLVKPADARRWLEEAKVDALCGSAAGVYAEAFNLPEGFPVHEIPEDMVMRIARLGLADEAEGRTMIPALASPLYVRDRVALTMQERARGERL